MNHVYLTENAAEPSPELQEQVRDFKDIGFLTYKVESRPQSQLKVYYDCMTEHQADHNWLAFFDVDEFLVLRSGCSPNTLQPDLKSL